MLAFYYVNSIECHSIKTRFSLGNVYFGMYTKKKQESESQTAFAENSKQCSSNMKAR